MPNSDIIIIYVPLNNNRYIFRFKIVPDRKNVPCNCTLSIACPELCCPLLSCYFGNPFC